MDSCDPPLDVPDDVGAEMVFIPFKRGNSLPASGRTLRGRPLYAIWSNEGTLGRDKGAEELFSRGRFGSGFMA